MKRLLSCIQWLLGYRGIPFMSRPTFRYEIISTVFVGVGSGLLAPSFTQLFARKTLYANKWIIAALLLQIAVGILFGAFLGPYLQRHRRIRYVVAARLLIAASMLGIALLPPGSQSASPYLGMIILTGLLTAVVLSVLSSVWHSNYPAEIRGQIFSRRYIVNVIFMVCSMKLAGYVLDAWPWGHYLVYSVGAACMVAGAILFSRIRVRGERSMLRREAQDSFNVLAGFALLWRDRQYGRFMAWQMVSGSMTLLTYSIVLLVLTDHLKVSYTQGTTAIAIVGLGVAVLAAPICGRLFDTLGVSKFRAIGAAMLASSRVVLFTAAIFKSWPLALVAFVFQGLGMSTGGLAFSIGHTRFAHPQKGQLYMGIHMTLQGLRGLTMPFLGMWLYETVGMGISLLIVAAAVQFIAVAGFALSPRATDAGATGG